MTREMAAAEGRAAAFELRPGVYRPDWSVVTEPAARKALNARTAARPALIEKWATRLDDTEDLVWRSVLTLVPALGRLPQLEGIASAMKMPRERLARALRRLQRCDLLALDEANGSVVHVYPFTSKSSAHHVRLGGHVFDALCAVDALGIGAMYRRDVAIESCCRFCDAQIRIATVRDGTALGGVSPADAVVWYDIGYAYGCAATSCCPNIVFFCSDEHLRLWSSSQGARRQGCRLSPDEALEIGRALFAPVLMTSPMTRGC